ncbi:MAG: NADH-quinone oxidoreductase subunit J [Cyanobacteria bacterium]|nr:NADH-quinone oxidoreductase subunit J [Cyanobacteriota bacterium]
MQENHVIDSIIFWVFALLSVGGALGVVLHRSIIYSALFLIVVFMSIAGFFVLNNADFLAIAQTIVYGVGLTIVMIFGVMFTGDRDLNDDTVSASRKWAFAFIALMSGAVLISSVYQLVRHVIKPYWMTPASDEVIQTLQTSGSTPMLGKLLFQDYVLPFEIASILLLVAMIGAIIIAKKKFADVEDGFGELKFEINTESDLNAEAEDLLERTFTAPSVVTVNKVLPTVEGSSSNDADTPEMAGVK